MTDEVETCEMEIPNVCPIVFSKYSEPDETESILCSYVPCAVASTSNIVIVLIGVDDKLVLPIAISIGLFCEIIEDGTKSFVISNVKIVLILLFEVLVL